MILNFENIEHLFTISLALLFSFFMFFNKTKERSGNVFIGLFVLFFGIESLDALLGQSSFYSTYSPNLYLILPNLSFLFYPVFFFYIKSVTYKGFKLKWGDLIHLTPYLIIVIITFFEFHLKPTETQLKIMTFTDMPWFISIIYYSLRIQSIVYLVLSIRVAFRFKKIVKENYSSINKRNYKWILQLTFVFVYFVLTALIHNILKFGFSQSYEKVPFYILSVLVFLYGLFIKESLNPIYLMELMPILNYSTNILMNKRKKKN